MDRDDFITATVLSIYYHRGKLGAAYYSEQTAVAYILHDLSEDFEFRMLDSLLRQVCPTVVLASKAQDITLLTFLNHLCNGGDDKMSCDVDKSASTGTSEKNGTSNSRDGSGEVTGNEKRGGNKEECKSDEEDDLGFRLCALHLMPEVAYDFDGAKRRIAALFESIALNGEQNSLKLAFRIDITSTCMVRAFGALLKYLDAVRLGVEFEDYNVKTPIIRIKTFTIEHMLEMHETTFSALCIFQKQAHPSASTASTSQSGREGISLFRMCNRCCSRPGKVLLRRWFERPTMDCDVLKNRLNAVEFFVQECNLDAANFARKRLKRICSPKGILKRAQGGQLTVNDWRKLYLTCRSAIEISEYIKLRELKFDLLTDDLKCIDEDVVRLAAVIAEIVNFEEADAENRFVVNQGVDHHLDERMPLNFISFMFFCNTNFIANPTCRRCF
uniref:MUTSd domain-containing protein n=1 Tax=Ascaris lumbricoides TaxID=6252 RepID=A0A0M3IJ25_ASCLU